MAVFFYEVIFFGISAFRYYGIPVFQAPHLIYVVHIVALLNTFFSYCNYRSCEHLCLLLQLVDKARCLHLRQPLFSNVFSKPHAVGKPSFIFSS